MNSMMGRYGAGTAMALHAPVGAMSLHAPTASTSHSSSTQKPRPSRAGAAKSTLWYHTDTITSYPGGPGYSTTYGYSGAKRRILAISPTAYFLEDGYAIKKANVMASAVGSSLPSSSAYKSLFHKISGSKTSYFRPAQKAAPNFKPKTGAQLPGMTLPSNGGSAYVPPSSLPSAMNTPSNGTDSGYPTSSAYPDPMDDSGQMVPGGDGTTVAATDDSEETPFYKNPMVLIGAAVLAGGAYFLYKGKKGKKEKKEHKA